MRRRPLIAGLLTGIVLFAGFWELAEDFAHSQAISRFDAAFSAAIQSLRGPATNAVMYAFTLLGGVAGIAVLTVPLVLLLLVRGMRREAIVSAVLVAGGAVLSTLMKNLFERPRPPASFALIELPSSWSFPSGHTMGSMCFAAACIYAAEHSALSRRSKSLIDASAVVFAGLVAMSRVFLGVHYPSDVLASWLLGGAFVAIVLGIAEASEPR